MKSKGEISYYTNQFQSTAGEGQDTLTRKETNQTSLWLWLNSNSQNKVLKREWIQVSLNRYIVKASQIPEHLKKKKKKAPIMNTFHGN